MGITCGHQLWAPPVISVIGAMRKPSQSLGIPSVFNDFAERLAGEPGFEPGLTESESAGLPLTYSPASGSLFAGPEIGCAVGVSDAPDIDAARK
jgi:hypothetical protein